MRRNIFLKYQEKRKYHGEEWLCWFTPAVVYLFDEGKKRKEIVPHNRKIAGIFTWNCQRILVCCVTWDTSAGCACLCVMKNTVSIMLDLRDITLFLFTILSEGLLILQWEVVGITPKKLKKGILLRCYIKMLHGLNWGHPIQLSEKNEIVKIQRWGRADLSLSDQLLKQYTTLFLNKLINVSTCNCLIYI